MVHESWKLRVRRFLWSLRDNRPAQLWLRIIAGIIIATAIVILWLFFNTQSSQPGVLKDTVNVEVVTYRL